MKAELNQKKGALPAVLATVATLLLGAFLLASFAGAVADGLSWKAVSERAMVEPDFVEPDTAKAIQVPDFTLGDRYGNRVSLSRFASADIILINIWSSGCPACKTEIPSLMEFDRRLSSLGRVALITIATDEKWEQVESYFPHGTDLRVLFDPEEKVTQGIFKTTKFPETFILDKQRRIRARFDGERAWHTREMLNFVASFK